MPGLPRILRRMGVSLHWSASRGHALSSTEEAQLRGLVAAHNASFAYDAQTLQIDPPQQDGPVLQGSTQLPSADPFATFLGLAHWCQALTDMRRALPDAVWEAHVDGEPVPWDDAEGYGWPEQRDPALMAEMQQLMRR
jgi:hypothetical protein